MESKKSPNSKNYLKSTWQCPFNIHKWFSHCALKKNVPEEQQVPSWIYPREGDLLEVLCIWSATVLPLQTNSVELLNGIDSVTNKLDVKGSAYKTETVTYWAAGVKTLKKKNPTYFSNVWVRESAKYQKPTEMGQLSVTGVKWKEINLGCLHGKMVREWERSGCWIWGYEGINHTSTCAWNTCGAFVQNSPKMPIRWIKVMECPPSPPLPTPPSQTLCQEHYEKSQFLFWWNLGTPGLCCTFLARWFSGQLLLCLVVCFFFPINHYWKIPSHFTSDILW